MTCKMITGFATGLIVIGLSCATSYAKHENCGENLTYTLHDVNEEIWECMVKKSIGKYQTEYSSDYPHSGISTTHYAGTHVLKYKFNTNAKTVTYEHRKGGATKGSYWTGAYNTRNECIEQR